MRLAPLLFVSLLVGCSGAKPADGTAKTPDKQRKAFALDRCTTGKEAAANDDELAGKAIARICVEGGSSDTKKKIDDAFALHAGAAFNAEALRADLESAYGTGLVDDLRANAYTVEGGKLLLVIQIHERPVVGAFAVEGAKANSNDELVKAFPLKVGDRYEPAKLRANVVLLRDGYRAAGYKHARIDHVVEPMNDGRVSVKLQIKEE